LGLLRILLAICVFCGHTRYLGNLRWMPANLAVESFFVVSGFYMQLILTQKYTLERLGRIWPLRFYEARYSRLYPAYLFGCLLVLANAFLSHRHGGPLLQQWATIGALRNTPGNLLFKVFLAFTNLTMIFQDLIVFLASRHGEIHWALNYQNSDYLLYEGLAIPQAWSLGIEISFYLIAPILLKARSRWLAVAACAGLALKILTLQAFHLQDPWTYRFFPFELSYFLLGALAYRYRAKLAWIVPQKVGKAVAYLLAIAFACFWIPVHLATVGYPLTLAVILPGLFRATAKSRFDRLIGDFSYPFYIYHLFALMIAGNLADHFTKSIDPVWTGLILTFALSALVLALEYRFIEPWRSRLAERGNNSIGSGMRKEENLEARHLGAEMSQKQVWPQKGDSGPVATTEDKSAG
jgi:peptidoglycan/LPS O-acetylase OafA/YrhL